MFIQNIFKISQGDKNKFCTNIIESSAPRTDFYFLVILSTLISAFGLLSDNVVLLIGGMVVAPLLSPLLALALGVVINEPKVIWRSARIFLFSVVFVFLTALIVGLFSARDLSQISLISKMKPDLFYFIVAVVAGLAAGYTWAKQELKETLTGVAITVTIIPPLTAIGLAVADANWLIFGNTLKVVLLNLFGIVIASLVVFSLMDFYSCKRKIVQEVKQEEKEIKKEKAEAEKEKAAEIEANNNL